MKLHKTADKILSFMYVVRKYINAYEIYSPIANHPWLNVQIQEQKSFENENSN